MTIRTITFDDEQWQVVPRELPGNMIDTINGHIDADSDAVALWRDALIDAPEPPAQQPMVEFDIAIAAGDGTLHGAIDHWQERALTAEAKLAAQQPMTDDQIVSACYTYRHDFGLLPEIERHLLMAEARRWADAFGKEIER